MERAIKKEGLFAESPWEQGSLGGDLKSENCHGLKKNRAEGNWMYPMTGLKHHLV